MSKQELNSIGPVPSKKWKKDADVEDKVKSINSKEKLNSVESLHEGGKQGSELHHGLLKQQVKDKSKQFGEESDDDQKQKPKTKQEQKREQKQDHQQKRQELNEDKRNSKLISDCRLCLQNEQIGENYILANGYHTMLLLPEKCKKFLMMSELYDQHWHVQIIPIEHVECLQQLEEEPWEEMRNFMKCLVATFDAQNMEAVFFENAYEFNNFPHCVLECVAIPYTRLKEAKLEMYFRQGMDELDGFWSTHKKVIKLTKEQGGIRKQIPKGFPYFYVDFATQFGYAHVIENEKYFSKTFAPEILATILGVDKNKVLAPQPLSNQLANQLKIKFDNIWKKFDWTAMIK